jgi:hypothetical protein
MESRGGAGLFEYVGSEGFHRAERARGPHAAPYSTIRPGMTSTYPAGHRHSLASDNVAGVHPVQR